MSKECPETHLLEVVFSDFIILFFTAKSNVWIQKTVIQKSSISLIFLMLCVTHPKKQNNFH